MTKRSYTLQPFMAYRFLPLGIIIFLTFLCIHRMEAQEPRLTSSGVSYMEPSSPVKHSKFTIAYKVSSNLFLEVRGQYDTYPNANVFKSALIAKRYLAENVYFFSGGEIERTNVIFPELLPLPDIPTQYRTINGVGYDVNPYFTIEAQKNFDINATNISPFSNPNEFSIRGKFKF